MGEPSNKSNLSKAIIVIFMIGMILFVTGFATDYWSETEVTHRGLWRMCTLGICTEGGFGDILSVLDDDNLKINLRKRRKRFDGDTEVRESDRENYQNGPERERESPDRDEEGSTIHRTVNVYVQGGRNDVINHVKDDKVTVVDNEENNDQNNDTGLEHEKEGNSKRRREYL